VAVDEFLDQLGGRLWVWEVFVVGNGEQIRAQCRYSRLIRAVVGVVAGVELRMC
jgi:hypothetical protein